MVCEGCNDDGKDTDTVAVINGNHITKSDLNTFGTVLLLGFLAINFAEGRT